MVVVEDVLHAESADGDGDAVRILFAAEGEQVVFHCFLRAAEIDGRSREETGDGKMRVANADFERLTVGEVADAVGVVQAIALPEESVEVKFCVGPNR